MKLQFSSNQFLNKLLNNENLNQREAQLLMEEIMKGKLNPAQISAVLIALKMQGETAGEILGFISVMRRHMISIKTDGVVIDTCGTGGDGKGTFNISTAAALVVAGAGIAVAKHGNRNASSLCGSADVLEELGVKIDLSAKLAETMLSKTGFTFLFAQLFHPAMKYVAQVRKELKIRTVFNFLGPFVNPAQVKRQIIGVPEIQLAEKLALVAVQLDYEHLIIVSSLDGLDEISVSGASQIIEVRGKKKRKRIIKPQDFGIKLSFNKLLNGGNKEQNAKILRSILEGEKGAKRDIVLLNSAAALYVSGKAKSIYEGMKLAEKSIDSGKAKNVLGKVIKYSQIV